MNKEQFMNVLQSALLHFDDMTLYEITGLGIELKSAKAGIKLCEHLKQQEI